jgi:hypothetical protein
MADGNAFKVSPRFGFVYDISGRGMTIVRGGAGIFYDRPQGNMVFDMGGNAPGVLNSSIDFGLLQNLTGATGAPNATLSLNPTAYGFIPPRTIQWNVGIQHKLASKLIFDIAYVGSKSDDLLRQSQINALPLGARSRPRTRIRRARRARRPVARRCRTTCCGRIRGTPASACGTTAAGPTTTRCRPRSAAGSRTASSSAPSTSSARR